MNVLQVERDSESPHCSATSYNILAPFARSAPTSAENTNEPFSFRVAISATRRPDGLSAQTLNLLPAPKSSETSAAPAFTKCGNCPQLSSVRRSVSLYLISEFCKSVRCVTSSRLLFFIGASSNDETHTVASDFLIRTTTPALVSITCPSAP